MIEIKAVNHDNWMECIELEVNDAQRQFVNPNIFSLAEAYAHSDANAKDAEEYYRCIPFAIYSENNMVGFAMITYEKECDFDDKPTYEIYRIMIDKRYQGNGYGRQAIELLINYIKTFPYGQVDVITVEWHPDNVVSEKIFLGYGFSKVGNEEDGAVVARLAINRAP